MISLASLLYPRGDTASQAPHQRRPIAFRVTIIFPLPSSPWSRPLLATKAGAFAPATICSIKCPDQADFAPKAPICPEVSAYGVRSLTLWGESLSLWGKPQQMWVDA